MKKSVSLSFLGCIAMACANPSSNTDARVAEYRAGVAIPEGTPETVELQSCLEGYAISGNYQYGTDPQTRWERDVEPCLKYGPPLTREELEAQGIVNPARLNL